MLWQRISPWQPDSVGGSTPGADVLIAAVLLEADRAGRRLELGVYERVTP